MIILQLVNQLDTYASSIDNTSLSVETPSYEPQSDKFSINLWWR